MSENLRETRQPLEITRVTQDILDRAKMLKESNKDSFGEYSLPDPNKVIYLGSVTKGDELIAIGSVPLLAEAVLVVNKKASVRDRHEAISLLLEEFKIGVRELDGLHAFIQDPVYSSILQKHFGFRKCKGEALYLRT